MNSFFFASLSSVAVPQGLFFSTAEGRVTVLEAFVASAASGQPLEEEFGLALEEGRGLAPLSPNSTSLRLNSSLVSPTAALLHLFPGCQARGISTRCWENNSLSFVAGVKAFSFFLRVAVHAVLHFFITSFMGSSHPEIWLARQLTIHLLTP